MTRIKIITVTAPPIETVVLKLRLSNILRSLQMKDVLLIVNPSFGGEKAKLVEKSASDRLSSLPSHLKVYTASNDP